jgi:hypothetical protein
LNRRWNLPWSNKGWYADEVNSQRDPKLEQLVQAEGRGKLDPGGYREDRPIYAVRGAPHNPYRAILVALIIIPLGFFLFDKLYAALWAAILLLVFFAGLPVVSIVFSARRIPAWHRARKVALEYISKNGGEMPRELRIWN